jgi:hypothetical protein
MNSNTKSSYHNYVPEGIKASGKRTILKSIFNQLSKIDQLAALKIAECGDVEIKDDLLPQENLGDQA